MYESTLTWSTMATRCRRCWLSSQVRNGILLRMGTTGHQPCTTSIAHSSRWHARSTSRETPLSNDWHDIWLPDPEEHDFPAAQDFLELQFEVDTAEFIVGNLKLATTITKKAKDILRASWLTALPEDNIHVRKNLAK